VGKKIRQKKRGTLNPVSSGGSAQPLGGGSPERNLCMGGGNRTKQLPRSQKIVLSTRRKKFLKNFLEAAGGIFSGGVTAPGEKNLSPKETRRSVQPSPKPL